MAGNMHINLLLYRGVEIGETDLLLSHTSTLCFQERWCLGVLQSPVAVALVMRHTYHDFKCYAKPINGLLELKALKLLGKTENLNSKTLRIVKTG